MDTVFQLRISCMLIINRFYQCCVGFFDFYIQSKISLLLIQNHIKESSHAYNHVVCTKERKQEKKILSLTKTNSEYFSTRDKGPVKMTIFLQIRVISKCFLDRLGRGARAPVFPPQIHVWSLTCERAIKQVRNDLSEMQIFIPRHKKHASQLKTTAGLPGHKYLLAYNNGRASSVRAI